MSNRYFLAFSLLLTTSLSWAFTPNFDTGFSCYKKKDYACALKHWEPLANQGDSDAQFNIGVMYANGQGVAKDDEKAVYWYRKAAEQGYVNAQYNLGVMYYNGYGIAKNTSKAFYWESIAAAQGHENGKTNFSISWKNWKNFYYSTKSANIRKDAGNDYPKVASLSKGEKVAVIDTKGNWYQIITEHYKNGWVYAPLLSSNAPSTN